MYRKALTTCALLSAFLLSLFDGTEAKAWWWYSCGGCYSATFWGCGGWYLGVRPGPIRRLLFGPYRWYWIPGGCCYVDCCVADWGNICHLGCPEGVATPLYRGDEKSRAAKPAELPKREAPTEAPLVPDGGIPPLPAPAGLQGNLRLTPGSELMPEGMVVSLKEWDEVQSAEIVMEVPPDAVVKVNGYLTKSTGPQRRFVSLGLVPGHSYRFHIEVELSGDGRVWRHSEVVLLSAGQRVEVVMNFATEQGGFLALRK